MNKARQINRVALYARVSTDEQAQEGTSIETQLEFLRSWAKLNGYEVYGEYIDPGFSGATNERPGLMQLASDGRARPLTPLLLPNSTGLCVTPG